MAWQVLPLIGSTETKHDKSNSGTVPGIDSVYIHKSALFDTLLKEQEKMTAAIFKLMEW